MSPEQGAGGRAYFFALPPRFLLSTLEGFSF
jgi:hypothetical protein